MNLLTASDELLLTAMIATVGVVWAIGYSTYHFVWNYFWSWAKDPLKRRSRSAQRSVLQNLLIYALYLAFGGLALLSILMSAWALQAGVRENLPIAWFLFGVAVIGHASLFTFELLTSIFKVRRMLTGRERR